MTAAPVHEDYSLNVKIRWNAWLKIQRKALEERREPAKQAAVALEQYADRLRFQESEPTAELVA